MGAIDWLVANGLDLGLIISLLFAAHSLRKETQARQVGNLIALTQNHNTIWRDIYGRAELSRVRKENISFDSQPLTNEERVFVTSVIVHARTVHYAMQRKMFAEGEGLKEDIRVFISLPVPQAVWKIVRSFQDEDFIDFVEN